MSGMIMKSHSSRLYELYDINTSVYIVGSECTLYFVATFQMESYEQVCPYLPSDRAILPSQSRKRVLLDKQANASSLD